MWASRGGGSGEAGESLRESDVSATPLKETVRIPPEEWPDSLIVTAAGLQRGVLAIEGKSDTKVRGRLPGRHEVDWSVGLVGFGESEDGHRNTRCGTWHSSTTPSAVDTKSVKFNFVPDALTRGAPKCSVHRRKNGTKQ